MSDSAVLVIGGGATGLQAAARLADAGARVLLIDKMETVGGKMAALLSHDPALLHMNGDVAPPSLDALRNNPRIEVMTLAELTEFSGKPGRFRATIEQKARFVTDACTQCNKCRQVCPVVLPNEHESGMTFRKAIYTPYRDAIPSAYVIDINHCLNEPPNYLPCQRCVEVCEANCIDFSMPATESFTRKIDAVVVAVGFDLEGTPPIQGYSYGRHPDIVTGMELESLLSPVGPTGGFVERPFNSETPEKMLFILHDASLFAWACAAAQTRRLLEQDITDITVLHNTARPPETVLSTFWKEATTGRVKLIHGEAEKVDLDGDSIVVQYSDVTRQRTNSEPADMVVLAAEASPSSALPKLAKILGIALNEEGFVRVGPSAGDVATSRAGIYAAGCAISLKEVTRSLSEAAEAATLASQHARLNGQTKKTPDQAAAREDSAELDDAELAQLVANLIESIIRVGETGNFDAAQFAQPDNPLRKLRNHLARDAGSTESA